jgi:preprotein translocase subunit SecA
MKTGISLKEKIGLAYGRAKGIPVETDLEPYMHAVRSAREFDFSSLSEYDLARRGGEPSGSAPAPGKKPSAAARSLALAAEACRRGLGLEPYEEQLIAALALLSGRVAQMRTGEGKTLAAALAASVSALEGLRVHILTANDYLARRDAEWMSPIYRLLGLSVAWISGESSQAGRREAYRADVAYLTARELGFDYLRDGLAYDAGDAVQGAYSSAIVDEADSVLIDEARVPLVIAGAMEGDGLDPRDADRAAASLRRGIDFRVDREGRSVALTGSGERRLRDILEGGAGDADLSANAKARAFAALHARELLFRDADYVVKDGAVKLVDSFTGRVAERRQWPWGIQAALEAKEGLAIGQEGRIYSSITVQNLVGLYPRLSAMTATAVPAAKEFATVYGMRTLVIPPNRAPCRIDRPDLVFWNRAARDAALVSEIAAAKVSGRPVLVGTASVRDSEKLAAALAAKGVGCVLLNAKNDEAEARLIASAGQAGAVTISTNMAGRGTDIKLGAERTIAGLGGLYVIGTSKHESRRVDDQLRGRAGRQGDPGETRFFLSLDDELFVRYRVREFLPPPYRSGTGDGQPIEDPAVARELDRAQAIIETQNARIRAKLVERSLLVEYDRRYIRQLRDAALLEMRLPEAVEEAIADDRDPEALRSARPALVRAFLARLDAAWADHLAMVEDLKEGIGLVRIGGRDPAREFIAIAGGAFETAVRELEAAAVLDCADILAGRDPGAGREAPPSLPSSTWTYVVDDTAIAGFDPGLISGAATLALGHMALPLLLLERFVKRIMKGGKDGPPPEKR